VIHSFEDARRGFDVDADVVVVGSGAGGAVAAANLSRAGLRTVVIEAGPRLSPEDMTDEAPRFMARYFWEGGLRTIGGTTHIPTLQARCLGGSTVVNSAIMLELPAWVRRAWSDETGLTLFTAPALDAAYARVFARTRVAPTPMTVLGRRNLVVRDALTAAGMKSGPLPRAVVDCEGCAECFTGCASGRKQSLDRSYIVDAVEDGAEVFTCAHRPSCCARACCTPPFCCSEAACSPAARWEARSFRTSAAGWLESWTRSSSRGSARRRDGEP